MRIALALGVIAVAWSAALYVHQRNVTRYTAGCHPSPANNSCDGGFGPIAQGYLAHPEWEDPVAVLIAIGSLAVAAGITATGRRGLPNPI